MSPSQKSSRARMLRIAAAIGIAVLGLFGLIIPILPGIPLLIVAAVLLGSRLPIERRDPSSTTMSARFAYLRLRLLQRAARLIDRHR